MVNTNVGHFKLVREITQDEIGSAFEVIDQTRNKRVILKRLRDESPNSEILQRLYSEAKTLASLNHPHLARVFGFVRHGEHVYLVMEFVEGEALDTVLKRQGSVRPTVALSHFHQILSGVAFAHDLGVIHGDLKPSNIVLPHVGPLKILGFAVAHILGHPNPSRPVGSSGRYRSPEQIAGAPPDVRSDIYSMGALLYEWIVGRGPFDLYGRIDDEFLTAKREFIPVPPSSLKPDTPKWLDDILLRALATSPADRFQSVKAMEQAIALAVAQNNPAVPARRVDVWGQQSVDCLKRIAALVSTSPARASSVIINAAKIREKRAVRWRDGAVHWIVSTSDHLWLRLKLPFLSLKTDWKRYAFAICLLALVSVELFYFGGANIFFPSSSRLTAIPSLNDSVDSMFAKLDQQALKTGRTAVGKEDLVPGAERKNLPRHTFLDDRSRPPIVSSPSERLDSLPMDGPQRSYSAASNPERQINPPSADMPIVKDSNVSEPVKLAQTTQNNSPKSQLNVRWEN